MKNFNTEEKRQLMFIKELSYRTYRSRKKEHWWIRFCRPRRAIQLFRIRGWKVLNLSVVIRESWTFSTRNSSAWVSLDYSKRMDIYWIFKKKSMHKGSSWREFKSLTLMPKRLSILRSFSLDNWNLALWEW